MVGATCALYGAAPCWTESVLPEKSRVTVETPQQEDWFDNASRRDRRNCLPRPAAASNRHTSCPIAGSPRRRKPSESLPLCRLTCSVPLYFLNWVQHLLYTSSHDFTRSTVCGAKSFTPRPSARRPAIVITLNGKDAPCFSYKSPKPQPRPVQLAPSMVSSQRSPWDIFGAFKNITQVRRPTPQRFLPPPPLHINRPIHALPMSAKGLSAAE